MKKKIFLPWIILYLLIIGGATAWAFSVYNKNNEYRLPSGKVELTVSKTNYQLGETVEFTVTNDFPVSIFVINNCPQEPLNVYEWKNKIWVQLHDEAKTDAECYTEERNVEISSGDKRSYNFEDWPNLFNKPGVYRIATEIDHYSDTPFQDFVILEPAKVIEVRNGATPILAPVPVLVPSPSPKPQTNIFVQPQSSTKQENYLERENEREENDDD